MILERLQDVIVAPATPLGSSALAVVRVSGSHTLRMCDQVFRGKTRVTEAKGHTLLTGFLVQGEEVIDEAVAAVFRAPHSYTAEDLVEFSVHGNPLIVERVTDVFIGMGARLADPGEFTERAYLRGRIDITQAEAVLATIQTRTIKGVSAAVAQLKGNLSREIEDISNRLRHIYANVEAQLEFPEEDIPDIPLDTLLDELACDVDTLKKAFRRGRSQRQGLTVMLLGRTNVGKSTLFNALIGEDRSIVTPIPGTTRDLVVSTLRFPGGQARLFDGAGVGATESLPDKIAVRRAIGAAKRADFLVVILDAVEGLTKEDQNLLKLLNKKSGIVLWNKIDAVSSVPELPDPPKEVIKVSALKKINLQELKDSIRREVSTGGDTFFANRFQEERINQLAARLHAAREAGYLDMRAKELSQAQEALSGFDRSAITREVLDEIFSRFCVGK